ncbi:L-lactate permease [Pseudoalteromonas mariniglutinosa]|uniref:L-lactate permease n=1 Tax=Pseudoalteromonas mariniglutinosa TaxID=206042 RepID=UPI00384CE812
MNTVMAALPIIMLIWLMTKRRPLPSHLALPAMAVLTGLLQLFYFHADWQLVAANTLAGGLAVATPISIIAGAVLLNRLLAISGAEATIKSWLESISSNPVAQLMIIGWAFAFMIEGASGFGTPAAIAAPLLVGLGFAPLKVVVFTLMLNSVPVSFGAVGTPTWFGFSGLNLLPEQILAVSQWTALCHVVAAMVIVPIALRFVLPSEVIRRNVIYIYLSIFSCVLPYWWIAQWNYEFPSLLGGAIGLVFSVVLANFNIGLSATDKQTKRSANITVKTLLIALSPLLLLMVVLLLTRIQQLGIKDWLNNDNIWLAADLNFAQFQLSTALIVSLQDIFATSVSWSYKTLYVPAIIPFLLVVLVCLPLLKMRPKQVKQMCSETVQRIALPFIALLGALIMVNFMMLGEHNAPIFYMAQSFAQLSGENWTLFAAFLGALGTFFSGSATVSNLTFAGIQYSIAQQVGLPTTLILALQSVGAAMGNMICISNIIAVASIVGLKNQEGAVIKKTAMPMLIYGAIIGVFSYVFF